jgi:excisionase family DNA binding protein
MKEYLTIIEAARRVGLSDKTIRRAIHAGKLAARYPQQNRAEVKVEDLEAWHATLSVRPGETQSRLEALETQVKQSVDLWQKTNAAMDTMGVLQETLKFEVTTQLSKFMAILREQDEQIAKLTARVAQLESQVQATGAKKISQPSAELKLPEGHMWLSDFADQHYISRNEAHHLYEMHAISGQPISRTAKR